MQWGKKAHEIQVRLNTWISYKGVSKPYFGDFPYEALAPSINKNIIFNNIDNVYEELERLYDRAKGKSNSIGEALYVSAGFFVDYERLLDKRIQATIHKYIYCKASNTPPYATVQVTPLAFMEDFLTIDEEIKAISASESKENSKA